MSRTFSRQSSVIASPSRELSLQKEERERSDLPAELKDLYDKLKDAEDNHGDIEIRDILFEIAEYWTNLGNYERALDNWTLAFEKAGAIDIKIDICIKVMLIALKQGDLELLKKNVETARQLFEEGGDWERKNRFKAYEGTYYMLIRQFKNAATNFLSILSTFNSPELFSYQQYVQYTVIMSLVALDRATIRSKVVHAPEILSVIRELPEIKQFLESLFKCEYKSFFEAFIKVSDIITNDVYLSQHQGYWSREMRVVVYSQFLESYRSVTLTSMASSFGVSNEFLDKELSLFISRQRLPCKIDKVTGIIESSRPDSRSAKYQQIIQDGDFLLNRLQKLARVMDV